MTISASFSYDGGNGGSGTVTATVTGATPGDVFFLRTYDGGTFASDQQVADGSGNCDLVVSTVGGSGYVDGDQFAVFLTTDHGHSGDKSEPVLGATYIIGTPGTTSLSNPSGSTATWDHTSGDITISYTPYGQETDIFEWWDGGFDDDPSGTATSLSMTHNYSGAPYGDFAVLEIFNSTTGNSNAVGVWWYFAVDDTVYPGPGTNFSLSVTPSTVSAFTNLAGSQDFIVRSTLLNGPDDTANISVDSTPSGITANFSSSTIDEDGGAVTLHVTWDTSLTGGNHTIPYTASDGDDTVHGSVRVVVSNVWCVDTVDVANTSNPDVTVHSNYITSTQDEYFWPPPATDVLWGDTNYPATITIDGNHLPPPGRYTVDVTWLKKTTETDNPYPRNGALYYIRRNGIPLWPISDLYQRADTGSNVTLTITGPETNVDGPGPTDIPVGQGDILDVVMIDENDARGTSPIKWSQICFTKISSAPGSGLGAYLGDGEILSATTPDDWTTADNVNSQPVLIPNNNEAVTMQDFCVLDNGDIYLLRALTGRHSSLNDNSVMLYHYSASSNHWTLVSNDVWGRGYRYQGPNPGSNSPVTWGALYSYVSVDTDGTNVYLLFGDWDGTTVTAGAFHQPNFGWHIVRYDIVGGTLHDDMGGTLYANQPHTVHQSDTAAFDVNSAKVRVGPDGKVWVVWSQNTDTNPSGFTGDERAYCWYWNGSGWTDIGLPGPPDLTGVASYATAFVADCLNVDLEFRHHDGPSNWPCVFYSVNYNYNPYPPARFVGNWIYQEYDGTAWSYRIQFFADQVCQMTSHRNGFGTLGISFNDWWTQGFQLVDTGSDLVLVAAAGNTQVPDRGVAMRLKPGGTFLNAITPTAGNVDTFNRTQSPLSSGWTRLGSANLQANGSEAVVDDSGGPTTALYTWDNLAATDAEVSFTLGHLDEFPDGTQFGFAGYAGVILRATDSQNYYQLVAERGNFGGPPSVVTDRLVFSVRTSAGGGNLYAKDYPADTFQPGDQFCVQALGFRFFLWRKQAGGNWQFIQDVSDWTHSQGRIGITVDDAYQDFTHNISHGGSAGLDAFAAAPFVADFAGFEALQPAANLTSGGCDWWDRIYGNWNGTVSACSDGAGNLFVGSWPETSPSQYAFMPSVKSDYGTGDHWLPPKRNTPIDQDDYGFLPAYIKAKNGYLYVPVEVSVSSGTVYGGIIRYQIQSGGIHAHHKGISRG